jgi:hypothetical protein
VLLSYSDEWQKHCRCSSAFLVDEILNITIVGFSHGWNSVMKWMVGWWQSKSWIKQPPYTSCFACFGVRHLCLSRLIICLTTSKNLAFVTWGTSSDAISCSCKELRENL